MDNTRAVTEFSTNSHETFNPKVNNWAEGVLMTIDADNAKITIRGATRPYASEYAKMLKKIHDKTETMTQSERATATSEIRASWQDALNTARAEDAAVDSDMTFSLPGKDSKLVIVDETPFYNRKFSPNVLVALSTASLTDKECKDIRALKDLKVGECVVVGYESGVFRNDAHVVIKTNHCK